ncbi:uncharacterized protein LOC117320616 [Pecten maximus]|uniref:uncharacterized protein LOC117320616 n=1 Tax=Pecten maximus TaxID=6579 RepID=UPI001457F9B4|nr:uncharacterized protein LOC117320616 [Pecten maximus]
MAAMAKDVANDAEDGLQELLEKNVESVEMMTLRIVFCNPIGGDPFKSAVVTTQEQLSSLYDYPNQRTNLLKFKHVWDVEKLHQLIRMKRNQDQDQDHCTKRIKLVHDDESAAFRLLEAYLNDFAHHQKCLEKVLLSCSDLKESAMVLNAHLFGPLSDENCIINNHIVRKEDSICGCGCGKEIRRGNTGIGVYSTWHGFVDMIIKENLPVAILDVGESTADQEDEAEEGCVHDKQKSGTSQLIAETITNAFAQVNSNNDHSGLPIPAFGCTPKQLSVCLYDCKNDVLLKKIIPLHLFKKTDSVSTVIMIWLYMNFRLFMRRDVTDLNAHSDLSEYQAQFFATDANIQEFYSKVKLGFTGCKHPDRPILTSVVRLDKE